MLVSALVGVVAGVITSLSPCVLPVVLTASVPRRADMESGAAAAPGTALGTRSWRPYGVVAGLVLSFSVATSFGSLLSSVSADGPPTLYTLLDQPQNQRMTIRLTPDPGVQVYSFTFD